MTPTERRQKHTDDEWAKHEARIMDARFATILDDHPTAHRPPDFTPPQMTPYRVTIKHGFRSPTLHQYTVTAWDAGHAENIAMQLHREARPRESFTYEVTNITPA